MEAAYEYELVWPQLCGAPAVDFLDAADGRVITGGGRRVEQPGVGVAHDHRTAERAQALERLTRLRASGRDVAEADELLDTLVRQRGQHRLQRQ